jgi:hypothetical protein
MVTPSHVELASALGAPSEVLPINSITNGIEKTSDTDPVEKTEATPPSTSAMKREQQGLNEVDTHKADEVQELPTEVIYKIEYRHITTQKLVFEQHTTERAIGRLASTPASISSIIEVVTVVLTSASSDSNKDKPWTDTYPPPAWLIQPSSLKINSPEIIAALQSVVEYYPTQSFLGDSIHIPTPYALLVHH